VAVDDEIEAETRDKLLEYYMEWLESEKLSDLVDELSYISGSAEGDKSDSEWVEGWIDVRLRVFDGEIEVKIGDAQYDQDHKGFWSSGSLRAFDQETKGELLETARSLIKELG